ncbi:alpha/beta hydrolase [Nonomuraea pusilla]|uniref:alpha/beta fold hydrolase n=1 Tax=Nonomuraea pusilla TaxID=46177 RepID=UPI00332DF028
MVQRVQPPLVGPLTDPAAHGGDPADSFDVIIPDLPGFAWSTPVGRGDLNYWKIASILHKLMTEVLGYEKYAAAGSDYGALVTSALGHKYADSIIGLHYGHDMPPGQFANERFWDLTDGARIPEDATPELRAGLENLVSTYARRRHRRRAYRRLRERPHAQLLQRDQRQRPHEGRPLRPLREPEAFTGDVRETFRKLRSATPGSCGTAPR